MKLAHLQLPCLFLTPNSSESRNILDEGEKIAEVIEQAAEALAPKVIESALPALLAGVGKREMEKKNIFDTINIGRENLGDIIGSSFRDFPPTPLPIVVEIGKQLQLNAGLDLYRLIKVNATRIGEEIGKQVAPSLISAGLTALIGRRDVDRRNFLDSLKIISEGILREIEATLPKIPTGYPLPPLLSGVGKREIVEAGLLGHVKDEMLSVVDKLKESVEGAEKIDMNLESNLKTAAQGLASGQDVKALAQTVLSTLEADVKSMMDKGTFDVDIDSLIKNIVPNAVAKLIPKHSRRFLLGDIIDGLKDTLGDDILDLVSGTAFGDLKTFLGNIESTALQSPSPALENLKALAQTFLTHAGQANVTVAVEAAKAQLGSVYTQIKNVAAKLPRQ